MAYATISDIFKRYPPINTLVGSGTNEIASVDVASVYISDAEGLVNAYIGSRYTVPVQNEPIITWLTSEIAIYNMVRDKQPRIPEWMQSRFDRAMEAIAAIRDGSMTLTASGTLPVVGGDQEAWSATGSYTPIFSPVLDELDQRADPDYIAAEYDARRD